MADRQRVRYGECKDEYIDVISLSDELRYVQLMKLYKAFGTIEDLENALTAEAKEAIRLID